MAQEVELPDFGQMAVDMDNISQSHGSLARNMAKMQNIPAFNPGAQILEELRALREEMRALREETRALREEMRQGFGNMERRLDAT